MTISAAQLSSARGSLRDSKPALPRERHRLPQLPVAALLESQATLTAVERFSRAHDDGTAENANGLYRDWRPRTAPKQNEQSAFDVDLDACTGCKACVAACHTLNGLDVGESWRTVGLLHGGSPETPAIQTVTSSCHHCLEPACLQGCPVRAYEKDPITGIVRHLDDQCIGCQYCTLMCPYDAPKFNKGRGIVRKCDMCSDRLAENEAPACAQACPNQAISIRIVNRDAVIQACSGAGLLPGAPSAEQTLPRTVYRSARPMARNLLPADYYRTGLEHSHPALVIMLTLTQLSVGAFGLTHWATHWAGHAPGSVVLQSIMAMTLALVALGASIFHLGRPTGAWRVFLGLRTSWLSREAVGFGLFALLGSLYGALSLAPMLSSLRGLEQLPRVIHAVQLLATVVGLVSVFFSVMVYVATRRANWSATQTGIRFFTTTLSLGAACVLMVYFVTGGVLDRTSRALLELIVAATSAKLALELRTLAHARVRHLSVLKRVALLMLGELATVTVARFCLALFAGVILPLLMLAAWPSGYLAAASILLMLLLTSAELLERYMFFRTAPASHLPGGIR